MERDRETLFGIVEVEEMFPVEALYEGDDGLVVSRSYVDGVRSVGGGWAVACRGITAGGCQ